MIAPYYVHYGLKDLFAAIRGLRRPFPEVAAGWFPPFREHNVEVFPTDRGREGQYVLLRALQLPARARVGVSVLTHPVVWQTVAAADMQPVFLDADPVTFGLNLAGLRRKADQIDCLILNHTFGYPADFETVVQIMGGKPILEDCAHALESTYAGRPLGTLGNGSFFTFLFSKPLRAGGGGCAITRDYEVGERVKKLLCQSPQESFVQGFCHMMANLFIGLAYRKPCYRLLTLLTYNQLYRRAAGQVRYPLSSRLGMRRSDWYVVASRLREWDIDREKNANFWNEVRTHLPPGWHTPPEPAHGEWNHWLLPICCSNPEAANRGVANLRTRGVGARMVYRYSPLGARSYGYSGDCPEAERLSRSLFILPAHRYLSAAERRHILQCLRELTPTSGIADDSEVKVTHAAA